MSDQHKIIAAYIVLGWLTFGFVWNSFDCQQYESRHRGGCYVAATLIGGVSAIIWPAVGGGIAAVWVTDWP